MLSYRSSAVTEVMALAGQSVLAWPSAFHRYK